MEADARAATVMMALGSRDTSSTIAEIAGLRGEDARSIPGPLWCPGLIERYEADTALHDERMVAPCDDMTKAHPSNGVGGQPRLHPNLDR
jgi:hypothetical protein